MYEFELLPWPKFWEVFTHTMQSYRGPQAIFKGSLLNFYITLVTYCIIFIAHLCKFSVIYC